MSERRLGTRAEAVFSSVLSGRSDEVHPADLTEATAFWEWLGDFERPPLREAPPPRRHFRAVAAIAATVVAAVTGAAAFYATYRANTPPAGVASFTRHFATGTAERRIVQLADGSTVTLAPETRIDVAYTAAARHIRLTSGEALFEVAHNPRRPFLVRTLYGEVKAVGTAFDVSLTRHEAKVVVVEGVIRIALRPGGNDTGSVGPITKLAHKGESVAFGVATRDRDTATAFIRQSESVDGDTATAWTRGKLVFHGEPLAEVIARINLYSRDRLVLSDPRAGTVPVYGVVDQGDATAVRDLIDNPNAVAIEKGQ